MLIEQLPPQTRPALSHFQGVDLAGLQGDGTARASDDGRRRVLACPAFPAEATPQVCVAAWHGVLHWLRHDDQPVITCQVGRRAQACWTIVTSVDAQTALAQLLVDVTAQWLPPVESWLDLRDPAHAELLDPLRCPTIRLEPGSDEVAPEFALENDGGAWRVSCAASRYSESYQCFLIALWHQFVVALLDRPQSLLSAQRYGNGDAGRGMLQAGMAGPVVSIAGNLVQRFAGWVVAAPDKPAVIDDHGRISYAALDALSGAWAQALQTAGVRRGSYVGVALGRSRALVAAQLAVLKTGAAFVPMDVTQPAARLEAMVEDTDMQLVLGDAASAAILRDTLPNLQCLVADELPTTPNAAPVVPVGTDDMAYVIFTSGSTGRPKGVKVSHGNLLNFVEYMDRWIGADGVVSQFAPSTFDASVGEIHIAILNGATLVILWPALIDDPERLQAYLSEQGVTFAAFPPQYAQHLSPTKLPRLKTLMTAGSATDRALIARWQPHLRYINAYGPTETTILSTAWQARRVPAAHEPIVIGTPFCNTEVRVVNRFNQALPPGVIGELLIGGEGVAHGYLKRDALTRDRFITLEQTRWYRSGDLSCFDADGQLIFAGRVDRQVKLRGHRLEPGEVETALLSIDGIRQAAVVPVDVAAAKQLVAFCVGVPQTEQAMRERLGQQLPVWALPNRIVWLERLPLTANGKTDYASLVASLAQAAVLAEPTDYADALEAQLAAIWRGVLQQPRILREDNFIYLGGDSLTSLVVTSAVKRLGYQPTSAQLLQHPRLCDYARLLRVGGQRLNRDYVSCAGVAPLAPIQGWFFSLPLAHPGTFCQSLVFDSEEGIDAERLTQACARLTGYHDQLRARFVPDAQARAGWRQEILPDSLTLPALSVIEIADAQLDATSADYGHRLAAALRIDAAPLFRMVLIHTPLRSRVVWVLHHLVVDTVSHGILLDDLHQLYCSAETDVTRVLPGKSVAYGNWTGRLQDQVAGQARQLLMLWRPVLDAVRQADTLPLRRQVPSGGLAVAQRLLSGEKTSQLLQCASSGYRQSPEELVLAATYLALGRTLGVQRVAIDIEWHGRDEVLAGPRGVDRTVGWFTSVHPLGMAMPAGVDIGSWLIALKETRAAIPQRGRDFYSLRYLGDDDGVRAEFASCPRPDVLFNFSGVVQRRHAGWRSVPGPAIELGDGNASPYPLSVESELRGGELVVGLYHDPAVWPDGMLERLGDAIVQCLGEVIAHCSELANRRWTPSDFPQLTLSQAQVDRLPATVVSACPLTDMQQTMLRHKDTYQVHMCYRLPRPWDAAAWRAAVASWVARHDCLRTYIQEWDEGEDCQVVLKDVPLPLGAHHAAKGHGEELMQSLLREARSAEVRLDRAPLFALTAVVEDGDDGFVVLLSIHHIIHDGWSIELLLNDLLQTYRHRRGEAVPLPGAPLAGMADVVAQQRRLRASADWRAYFAGLPWTPTACQLPERMQRKTAANAGRPDTQLYLGRLAPDLVATVQAAARERGVTINSLWLAGYVGLLRYLGGHPQVRCGVIQTGRMEDIPGVETITGCCVNTLPLVLDVPAAATFGDIVASVGSQLERMRASAAFPLSLIHEAVKPVLADEMFSSLFNIESHRYGTTHDLRPTLVGGYEATNHVFIFGLIERAMTAADGLTLAAYDVRIGYDAERYDTATVARWLEIYACCMAALVARPDEPWHRLQLLPAALRQKLVEEWNATQRDYPSDRCVHELFREQAKLHPTRQALLYKDTAVSYAELDEHTDSLARVLRVQGVGPEKVVGLVAERSPEMVVAILAVFKAGGAYVPIDPRYPAERVRHMVRDVGCQVVLFQRRDFTAVIPADLAVVRLYLNEPVVDAPDGAQAGAHHSRQLAYVMYTSGSTGHPKGVMIEHRSIVRLVASSADFAFAADDRILLTSAPGFDVTTWEVWSALLNGLPLVIVDEETLLDPAALAAETRGKGVTTLWLIAPLFNQLVQERPDLFAGVRQLMIGGDALSAPHVQLARRANPGLRVLNGYGPTENTSFSTYHLVSDADAEVVPIGRPITNSTAYVVSRDGQLLPPGVAGELYVGGPGVARGYLNQAELTAAKFVLDPYSAEPDSRLYRTGDLVRWREDGLIDFLGRIDHQVKIRGFRVELGEIETAIAQQDQVKQVIVLVKHNGNQKQLVAYLIAKRADSVDPTTLIASVVTRLRTVLPDYMVPAAFVVLDAMPRNANGKIDRARLPEPDASAYARGVHAEPQTAAERTLWTIWKEILGTDSFGVTDGFFAIGGDSILAIQVVAKARKHGLALTSRLIVEEQTIRKLVGRVPSTHASAAAPTPPAPPAERAVQGEQRLLPIHLQFLQDDGIEVDGYCQYALVGLPAGVAHDRLLLALAALVGRHDVLRLRFRATAGSWVAYYRPELLAPTTDALEAFFDPTPAADEFDPTVHVAKVLAQLDVRQGRLFAWRLVLHGGERRLLWVMHHLVVDAVSWRLLAADLATALAQLGRGEAIVLGAKPTSYQDWSARLYDYVYSPALERERTYWLAQLAQPSARLRLDVQDADARSQPLEATTATIEACLGAEDTRLLLQRANARYATDAQLLLVAALGRALGEWLAVDAVRIDLEGPGRESPQAVDLFDGLDVSHTVGWFTIRYPLHLGELRADLGAQIRRNKAQLAAVPNNGLGYGVLLRLAQDEEIATSDPPAAEILFNYLGQFDSAMLGGSQVSPRRRRTHALRIEGLVREGVLALRFDYSREQFAHGTIAALAARYVQTLREIVAHCVGAADTGIANTSPLAVLAPPYLAALKSRYPGCKDVLPCTGMQQGLLLFSARAPQSGLYHTQVRIELDGTDPVRMRQSWQGLLDRHDVLGAAFVDCGQASLLQVICAGVELPWREVDGRTLRNSDALERLLEEERTRPFNIAEAPLMRLLLVRTGDTRHCLAWTHHHALLDGWSMGLLFKELFSIYARSEPVAATRSSWRDYIEWLWSRDRPAAERYWHAYFDGLDLAASASLPPAPLGADDTVAPRRYEQALETLVLSSEATARLTRLARAEGVGLGTLMLAAWGLLLSKYNSEPEVLFGYTTSGRSPELVDSESLIGLCINSLPLRLKIDGDRPLGAWLKEIQRRQLDHEDHGHLALADIQRCSGTRTGQALFDSLVVIENYPLDLALPSATANLPRIVAVEGVGQSDFALNLAVYPGERLTLKLAYRSALFDAATIATLLQRLERLLAGFARGGTHTLAQLSILSAAEQERAVRQWNDTAVAYPGDRALPALFEATARTRGAAVAIVWGGETWTYEQLDQRVRVLAAWLARSGVSAGSHVALSLRKEPALIAAMLAIMRVGAAYVPIALDCPPERRAFLLADAGIHFTLTRRSECATLADGNPLCLEDCPAELVDADCRAVTVDPQATAYVIYTSGTTGIPKGVVISHRNLVNFCSWCTHAGLLWAGVRMTQFAPYTFDASAGEIFAGLLAGAELHLLADALLQDPRALAQYLCAHDIRFAAFPPTYLQQMEPELVPAELTLLTAGSAPTLELVQRWGARCRYINGYGPTETTILSSAWICERGAVQGRALSIGLPIANTRMYVVDRLGQLCAPGLIGEICIGGDGVAQGYLNRPELTDHQFVRDPWRDGGRIYRTGDHGRWLNDGSIEFVGRRDRQVKLRGFRIELNEIENRLRAHPQVQDAAVLVRGTDGEQRLLAWIVPAPGAVGETELIAAIREFMRLSMPDYMLPQALLPVAQLPLTAHGKLDEKALPEPAASATIGGEIVPARTATEACLTAIWAAVLQLRGEQIGATSDFFALGGHSLLAMRVIARVREELGADVNVAELFARPVLAELAETVDRAAGSTLPPIVPIPRDGPLPLSYAQQRLWFLAQMEGVSATYNVPGALRLSGPLDRAALRRALDRIVERHETLRTTLLTVSGEPRQRINAATSFALHEHDLRGLADANEQLVHLMRVEANAVFDLAAGPLIRGRLVQLHDDEHVLQITMHHIVMDGWSLALLLRELGVLYGAYIIGGEDPLPALVVQYADYAAWQRQWLAGKVWQEQSDYWQRTLAGAPALLELPADRPRPAQQDYTGDLIELAFDAERTAQLKALGRRQGTTMFMTLLAAWSVVLSKLSGQQDLVIGSPVTNRARLEIEPLIGFFVNSLALRVDLSGNPTLSELLQRVKRQVLDAQRYQQLPFEQVVKIVQPPRSLAHTPVFQVMFNWQDQGLGDFALAGLQTTSLRPPYGLSKFDLTLDLSEAGDGIVGSFEYATALFDAATIERQAGYLHRVVAAMAADPDQRVQSLDLLGADEHRLLLRFNDTSQPELYDRSWPELFDAQVVRTPERIAVRCDSAQLTYRELHARATQLAASLVAHGAGRGQIVALLGQRGIDLLVMMVAVLKSGAAYLPLDPAHPAQRWLDVLREVRPLLLWVGDGLATEQRWLRRKWLDGEVSGTAQLLAAVAPDMVPALPYPALGDLAYVLYTSGSTGKPKGVMIEHLGMINNMRSKFAPLGLGADDVIAQTASQCFDISVWQFLTALLLGAKVLIVSNELTRDPEALLDHLATARATLWEPVPSLMQAALPARKPLPSLRWVLPTGEALSRELVARWFEQYPGIPLMNAYGPAECSDDVAFQPIHAPVDRVLIGKPVANAHLHVVDENLMRVPLGAVGELAVSGPVVGRGYIGRPEETQAAFRPNPYAQHAADQRLYLTGDFARRWPDGSLEFIGRKDFQVKIRGFRIELGEIESCLMRYPAVREAVVVAHERGPDDRQLVAYVTLDTKADTEALQSHLRAQLPQYMLPAAIVVLDALPLNANGKVDRKALPAPNAEAYIQRAYEAPVGEVEQKLAEIWTEILKLEQIGRHDNFFDLGGQSLVAVSMIERMRRQGLAIQVRNLYERPTLMGLAQAVIEGRAQGLHEFVVPPNVIPDGCTHITPEMLPLVDLTAPQIARIAAQVPGGVANIQDIYPLAPLQEGLLFHHLLRQKGDVYLIAALLRFDSRERVKHFADTLNQVIARHDILRTAVHWEGLKEPVQVVWRQACFEVELLDLAAGDEDGGDVKTRLLARTDPLHYPLDVRQAPLMHGFAAFEPASQRWLLQFVYHHLVADHTTLERLIKEMCLIQQGRESELAPSLPFRNYVAQARLGVSASAHEAFFREMLGDIDEPTAPFGLLNAQGDGFRMSEVSVALDSNLVHRLRQQARQHHVSVASVFHLAFAQVLAKSTGHKDVVFGTVLFGRMQGGEGADQVMGMFINTLPLRVRVGEQSVAQSLQATHTQLIGLLQHEHAPLQLAQRCSALSPSMPLFSALLNYRHTQVQRDATAVTLEGMEFLSADDRTNYLFDFSVDDMGDAISLVAQVHDSIGAQRACQFMQSALEHLVAALEQSPEAAIRKLEVLPAAERAQVLHGWNATERALPLDRCIHELFEAQVQRTPDAWAVVCGAQRLSYGDLNAQANRLAHHLRSLGVGPDTRVALCVERGAAMVVGLLAVFKAGGAYVPLDPSYPDERIGYMLSDSAPVVILSHGRAKPIVARQLSSQKASLRAVPLLDLETDRHLWAAQPADNPDPGKLCLHSRHLAYVIYTSGSTGKPKGVMVEHRGLVNYTLEAIRWFELSSNDIVLQQNSLNFDLSLEETLPALLCGAALLPSNELFGLNTKYSLQPTFVHLTAAHWQTLVGEWEQSVESARAQLGRVRLINVTGDALSPQKLEQWGRISPPHTRLINTYGPTEITISCSAAYVQHIPGMSRVSIGKPFANTQIYILDAGGQPVPIGVAGEMYIGGAGVARGYLNLDRLTAERFLSDPFSTASDARMYKTGDLARWLPNGEVEFIGRSDFQVKVRGFRVELAEVEGQITQAAGVQQVVVIAHEDGRGDKRLLAYYVGQAQADDLRAHAVAGLPEYMVPAAFLQLERLPLTPNGKLDRKALPESTSVAPARTDYQAPLTDTERTIAGLWAELLQVPQISRDDSYFDLGGGSLLMIRMLTRMKDLGFELSLIDMFQLRTVSACAAAIDAQRDGAAGWPLDSRWRHAVVTAGEGSLRRTALLLDRNELPRHKELQGVLARVAPAERPHFVRYVDDIDALSQQFARVGVAALAPAGGEVELFDALRAQLQEYQDRLAGAPTETRLRFSPIQRNLMTWRKRDNIDIFALDGWYSAGELQHAFGAVAAEQDLLRAATDGAQVQWRLLAADAVAAAPIPVVNLSGHDPARVDELLQRVGAELLAVRKQSPLAYVAAVVSLTDLEHRLLLAIDHLVWDGVSAAVLQRRLQERLGGTATRLQRNYRDYVEAAWRIPNESSAALLRQVIDRTELVATMDATQQALARRVHLPLQLMRLRLPANPGGEAADQAFRAFKQCVAHLTGLLRYGVVLNHHGRESGAERWFDHVGLFLDKVPFAADAETALEQLAGKAELLQKQGINYVGLVQVANKEWGSTLPALEYEVQFNFQTAVPDQTDSTDASQVRESLKDFRGILFGATASNGELDVHCAFRGEVGDVEVVRRIIAGSGPGEVVVSALAPEPGYSLGSAL